MFHECSLVDDTNIPAVMVLMQSGEPVFYYPYLSIFKTVKIKQHQTLSARESMCIIARQNCISDNFTGSLELGWRKQQKKHRGECSCTGKDREQPCIFSIFSFSDFLNAYMLFLEHLSA